MPLLRRFLLSAGLPPAGLLSAGLLLAMVAGGAAGVRADAPAELRRVDIADPGRYWGDNGFVELTPAIRVSVSPGARTVIYLKIPAGARLATVAVAGQQRSAIRLPPGSASDRVSLASDDGGTWTVEDVRGTRWGMDGREYFHVYRPAAAAAGARLVGYEWPRDDPALEARATDLLTDMVRELPVPFAGTPPSRRSVAQFRRLNACAACHMPDKPQATSPADPLPPWVTDASGLYVPLAVLADHAVLSATPDFDDPNMGDPFMRARCADDSPPDERQRRGRRYFHCGDGSMPIGIYDMAAARRAGDAHAARVCASRRYLYDRMDAAGRRAFGPAFQACGIG